MWGYSFNLLVSPGAPALLLVVPPLAVVVGLTTAVIHQLTLGEGRGRERECKNRMYQYRGGLIVLQLLQSPKQELYDLVSTSWGMRVELVFSLLTTDSHRCTYIVLILSQHAVVYLAMSSSLYPVPSVVGPRGAVQGASPMSETVQHLSRVCTVEGRGGKGREGGEGGREGGRENNCYNFEC